jgi:hypothetical protein
MPGVLSELHTPSFAGVSPSGVVAIAGLCAIMPIVITANALIAPLASRLAMLISGLLTGMDLAPFYR